jgi:hypothetical protein
MAITITIAPGQIALAPDATIMDYVPAGDIHRLTYSAM